MERRTLPPTYFGVALAAMLLLHLVIPGSAWLESSWRLLGVLPIFAGGALAIGGSRLFERVGTTIKPFEESSVLVIEGPFRYSRNPMYLGLLLILGGVALLLGTVTPLVVIPVFAVLIQRRFIRAEEAALEHKFGREYTRYRVRVRRWLGRAAARRGNRMKTASKQRQWNERYASEDLVWGIEPNRFLAEELGSVEPVGRVLDLACGEGRNAIWLAERGFQVTAVDFSEVAIERAKDIAARRNVEVEWICADATTYEPVPGAFDRVVILYLHLPEADRARALRHAVDALSAGGVLLMIGHALRNLTEGVGGPQQPDVLWEPERFSKELAELGLDVDRAEERIRPVEGKGDAVDILLSAHRPAA